MKCNQVGLNIEVWLLVHRIVWKNQMKNAGNNDNKIDWS